MSRRSRDGRDRNEPGGRSNERSNPYSSSRNDGRNSFPRPRHQTSQGWQNSNYYQPNSYNSNYQYQSRPRTSRPSSAYSHNTFWNQQWGSYAPPNSHYQSQRGPSNQQQPYSQGFTPFAQSISQVTHTFEQPVSQVTQQSQVPDINKSTESKIWMPDSDNPPLGSKEHREKALEESRDRLKKSLEESLNIPSSNFDGQSNSGSVLQVPDANPSDCMIVSDSASKSRSEFDKIVTNTDTSEVGLDSNLRDESQRERRRSSSDSNNLATTVGNVSLSQSSTAVNRRSRSSSLSSCSNSVSFGTSPSAKHTLQSSSTGKGENSVDVQVEKQRVIKELLSMNRMKLKELISYPRSRKIDMVMKYMIKESRVQQSYKQRQLAEAGIIGSHSESSSTLAQQDVEALLSDPDLHISLSNLPTEMIETLGNIFKLNSPDVEETDIAGEGHDILGVNSSQISESEKFLSSETYCEVLDTSSSEQMEYDVACLNLLQDLKPNINSDVEISDTDMSKTLFASDSATLDLSLDSLETSIGDHTFLKYGHSTDHNIESMTSPNSEVIFTSSASMGKSSIDEQTFNSTQMDIAADLDQSCQLPTASANSASKPSILRSEADAYLEDAHIQSIYFKDLTHKSVEDRNTMATSLGELGGLPEPIEDIKPVVPGVEEGLCAAPSISDQFPVPVLLGSIDVSESNTLSNGSNLVHTASNSQRLHSEDFESSTVSKGTSQVGSIVTDTVNIHPTSTEINADSLISSHQLTASNTPQVEDVECISKHISPEDSKNTSVISIISAPSDDCSVPLEIEGQGNNALVVEIGGESVFNTSKEIGSLTSGVAVTLVDNGDVAPLTSPLEKDVPLQSAEMSTPVITGLSCPQRMHDIDEGVHPTNETIAQPINDTITQSIDNTTAQPTNETITQPNNETFTHSNNGTITQTNNETITQHTNETINETIILPTNETITQPITESITMHTNETIDEPISDTKAWCSNETIAHPTSATIMQPTNNTITQPTSETIAHTSNKTEALLIPNFAPVNDIEEGEVAKSSYKPHQEVNIAEINSTSEKSIETSPKSIETIKISFAAMSHQSQDKLECGTGVLDRPASCELGLCMEGVEKEQVPSTATTVFTEKDHGLLIGMAPKTLDPMCILYESPNSINLRHASRALDVDDDVSISNEITADMANIKNHSNHEEQIMTDMSHIQVKSEKEDMISDTLQSEMQDHVNESNACRSPTPVAVSEIGTQTDSSSNAPANVNDVVKLLDECFVHPSQQAALNQLKQLLLKTTESVGSPPSRYLRCRQAKLSQPRKSHPFSQNITNRKHNSTPNDSPTTLGRRNSVDNVSLDLNFNGRNFQPLNIPDDIMSDRSISSQEALKSIFYNISVYEKQIENCMEMKKKLYDQVRKILESDSTQSATSSEQKDMVEVTSSSMEQVSISSSLFVPQSQALTSNKDVMRNNRKAAVSKSKSSVVQQSSSTSLVSLPSPRRGLRSVTGNDKDKTNSSAGNIPPTDCIHRVRVKKELSSTSGSDDSITLNRTTSRQKVSVRLQQKQKLGDQRASLSISASSDSCDMSSPPILKRSSTRIKSKCDSKCVSEKELVINPKAVLEESDKRYSLRNAEREVAVVVLSDLIENVQNVRTSRRRMEKEPHLEETFDVNTGTHENSSSKNIRRSTRSQVAATASNIDDCFELCILSPNLSRRTKGERKEILVPPDLQIVQPATVQNISPRRTTRHSVSEISCQETISEEAKKPAKRKIEELEHDDKQESLELLNTIRRCSVVLQPLSSHITKKSKFTVSEVQHESKVPNIRPTCSQMDLDGSINEYTKSDVDVTLSSDEDELPLLTIKHSTQSSNMEFGNNSARYAGDTDQHSISSSDTALADDLETTYSCHLKSKKNKPKKSRKEKQNEHQSKTENLEFIDHKRGTILDVKVIGRHLLAASEDGCLYCYSMKSGKLKRKYEGHQAAVTCLCTIDGEKESEKSCPEKVVTGCLDDYMRCFIFKTAELVHLPLKVGTALCVDQNWGIIYLGTKLGEVAKINAKTFSLVGDHMKFSTESILALKATKEGPRRVLIVGTRDQPVAIRDADTGLFLRTVSGEWHHTVCSLLLDKSFVYCGTMSGPIPVFDFTNGRELFRLHGGVGVRCLKIYNNLLFAGCYDGNIYIYNVKDQSLVHKICASGKMVLCLDVTKNKIIYSSKDALKSLNFPPEVSKASKEARLK